MKWTSSKAGKSGQYVCPLLLFTDIETGQGDSEVTRKSYPQNEL